MPVSRETLIKRFESAAETWERKGKRNWAYAKNGKGDFHYGIAKEAFKRAERNRKKAEALKNE
ncbi:MAG: hypothetical protein K6E38_07060 [Fretibacterium sp.]|nr:hypothetical protein [Fretibacterium sp.]